MSLARLPALAAVTAALGALGAGTAAADPGVLVVGDSLEVGTAPYLDDQLRGLSLTVDSRNGRPSSEGVVVLRARLRAEHRVLVFDLGTNDDPSQPGILAGNLRAAREIAAGRCLVVASVNRPPVAGASSEGLNRVIRDFVAETAGAQLVDWRAAAASDPGLLSADRIHATAGGYALRARLVGAGVRACLGAPGGATGLPKPRTRPAPPPRLPPPPRPRKPREAPQRARPSLLAGLAPAVLLDYARRTLSMLDAAADHARASLGSRPEPTLGAPGAPNP